jgi:Ala-tRNA(Pro) deacylase
MSSQKLKDFLDGNKVKYASVTHPPAYTAQEVAAMMHISGKEMAKTVVINVDGEMAMAVLPASFRVGIDTLRDAIGAATVELAGEQDFQDIFFDCDLGAMPPFGNLYGLDVYVAEKLTTNEQIVFNACSHEEAIRMSYHDFARLVSPRVIKFAVAEEG